MAVGDGDTRARGHRGLKHGDAARGGGVGGAVDEEADVDRAERDFLNGHGCLSCSEDG